jgi:23S rRNA (cytidine1920-2'-O)/16S rRNA (cytidine1409-2'-O)-methyltransferase
LTGYHSLIANHHSPISKFVSRAGQKLEFALVTFGIDVTRKICADLGCSTGGFVDCLLQRGAARVYAVDTGYGVLEWKLRNDSRVIVMERTNAMHVELPERVQIVTIDVSWTRQRRILPAARRLLAGDGVIVSLIKPHYEADAALLRNGVLGEESIEEVAEAVRADAQGCGLNWVQSVRSPVKGTGGNTEILALLREPAGRPAG